MHSPSSSAPKRRRLDLAEGWGSPHARALGAASEGARSPEAAAPADTFVRLNVQGCPMDVPAESLARPEAGLLQRLVDGSTSPQRDEVGRYRLDANPQALSDLFYALRHQQIPRGMPAWRSDMAAHEAKNLGIFHLSAEFRLERLRVNADHGISDRLAYADALYDHGRESEAWAEHDRAHAQATSVRHDQLVKAHHRRAREQRPDCPWRWIHCDFDDPGEFEPPSAEQATSAALMCARARWLMAPEIQTGCCCPLTAHQEAAALAERALAEQPGCTEAAGLLAMATLWLRLFGPSESSEAHAMTSEAALQCTLNRRPRNPRWICEMGDLCLRGEKVVLARSFYEEAYRRQPFNVRAMVGLGMVKDPEESNPSGDDLFHRAWLSDDGARRHYHVRAYSCLMKEDYENAKRFYQIVCRLNPDEVQGFLDLAMAAIGMSDTSVALEALEAASDLDCDQPELYRLRAHAHMDQGDSTAAEAAARQAVACDPEETVSLGLLASILYDRGGEEALVEALSLYRRVRAGENDESLSAVCERIEGILNLLRDRVASEEEPPA